MNLICESKMYEKRGEKDKPKKPCSLNVQPPYQDSNKNKSPLQGELIKSFSKGQICDDVEQKSPPLENQINETIYLCNFRVSVDGDWLCLKELEEGVPKVDNNIELPSEEQIKKHTQHMTSSLLTPTIDKSINYPNYPTSNKERDPVAIERSNLLNILKLVIREVLDSSLRFGRQLDSDHIPLQHFFIGLEHILRHGLKPKKGLLGPKKELWDMLQSIEKTDHEASDITASIRDLPSVNTQLGRSRAWLRLALMQKKLADYFRILIEQKDNLLAEYYEPRALLRSEEAVLITGLLFSLNIVDCNLCLKEENLDCQQGVIDFSLYLRNKFDGEAASPNRGPPPPQNDDTKNMNAVLDQKSYVEELNRHLNATVSNMQVKLENLNTTNALTKEDLSICKKALFKTQEENHKLLNQLEIANSERSNHRQKRTSGNSDVICSSTSDSSSSPSSSGDRSISKESSTHEEEEKLSETKIAINSTKDSIILTQKQQLQNEGHKRQELQRELKLQSSMKAETEMAMKLLEKDVHEKQDTIISLRDQLEDIKNINLEMYTKLQECETEISQKGELVSKLEAKTQEISKMLLRLNEFQ